MKIVINNCYGGFTVSPFGVQKMMERKGCITILKNHLGDKKPSAKAFDDYTDSDFDCARYLWKEERARLQTVPEKYVECMSEKEAADLLVMAGR
jgi:hypothetical protein